MPKDISVGSSEKEAKKQRIRLTVIVVTAIAAIAAVLSFLILISLKSENENEQAVFTAHEITQEIIKKMNYENLSEISTENISKYYEIPDGTIFDSSMYISSRTDNFTELACFTLRSREKEDVLLDVINDYISEKSITYQNVNDKAYAAISASRIVRHYPYILVSVSSDNDSVENTFELMFSDSSSNTSS